MSKQLIEGRTYFLSDEGILGVFKGGCEFDTEHGLGLYNIEEGVHDIPEMYAQLKDAQEERDVYFKTSEEINKAKEKAHDKIEKLESRAVDTNEVFNDLDKWLEDERDDWGCTDKDRTNPFMRTMSKVQELATR